MKAVCHIPSALLCGALLVSPISAENSVTANGAEPGTSMPELPGRGMESAQEKITDTWITAKVKSLFVYSKYVSANAINVETIDGVVILSGSIETENMRDTAVDIARTVRGVRKVNSNDFLVRSVAQDDSSDAAH